jgi:hypothetical protein
MHCWECNYSAFSSFSQQKFILHGSVCFGSYKPYVLTHYSVSSILITSVKFSWFKDAWVSGEREALCFPLKSLRFSLQIPCKFPFKDSMILPSKSMWNSLQRLYVFPFKYTAIFPFKVFTGSPFSQWFVKVSILAFFFSEIASLLSAFLGDKNSMSSTFGPMKLHLDSLHFWEQQALCLHLSA